MKHYVVTEGIYSAYTIIAVCFDRKDAEEIVKKFTSVGCHPEVEEYEDGREYYLEQKCFYFKFDENGEIVDFEECYRDYEWKDEGPYMDTLYSAWLHVLAKDEDHARKIATDRWAQWMAKRNGLC